MSNFHSALGDMLALAGQVRAQKQSALNAQLLQQQLQQQQQLFPLQLEQQQRALEFTNAQYEEFVSNRGIRDQQAQQSLALVGKQISQIDQNNNFRQQEVDMQRSELEANQSLRAEQRQYMADQLALSQQQADLQKAQFTALTIQGALQNGTPGSAQAFYEYIGDNPLANNDALNTLGKLAKEGKFKVKSNTSPMDVAMLALDNLPPEKRQRAENILLEGVMRQLTGQPASGNDLGIPGYEAPKDNITNFFDSLDNSNTVTPINPTSNDELSTIGARSLSPTLGKPVKLKITSPAEANSFDPVYIQKQIEKSANKRPYDLSTGLADDAPIGRQRQTVTKKELLFASGSRMETSANRATNTAFKEALKAGNISQQEYDVFESARKAVFTNEPIVVNIGDKSVEVFFGGATKEHAQKTAFLNVLKKLAWTQDREAVIEDIQRLDTIKGDYKLALAALLDNLR